MPSYNQQEVPEAWLAESATNLLDAVGALPVGHSVTPHKVISLQPASNKLVNLIGSDGLFIFYNVISHN